MPRVSAIIPTYNCGRFLDAAIRSVRAQSYRDVEIIVVDDGSTDDTRQVLERWANTIVTIRQENRGLPAARNTAIAVATGEFCAYLDADDLWLPHRLERGVAFLDAHPECGLVHGDFHVIDESGAQLFEEFNRREQRRIMRGRCLHELLRFSTICVPTVLERRACVVEAGGFDERLRYAEDYQHWIRVALNGHAFGYLEEPLALYRWRDESLSRSGDPAIQARWNEFLLLIFRPLLDDASLRARLDPTAEEIVRWRLARCHRNLVHRYRALGNLRLARAHALAWLRLNPRSTDPYVELAKSFVPRVLVERIRPVDG
ncbi:MAG: glycosyltransferase [Burkholderiaceae bacterium]|nr:glycosyltransferase [Burkholderiaceae bacterium]